MRVPLIALALSAVLGAQEAESEPVVLPTFNVTESKAVGYGTTNALGATRMNLPITDTSNSIVILNRELMDDLGALDGLDILKYASGVSPASTRTINVVSVRGEEVRPSNGANFIDGLPGGNAAEIETEFIERIEFVKGPAGSLYGSHSLGGVINRVSKRPMPKTETVLKTSYTSIGSTMQGSFDTNAPLADTGIAYRVVGVLRDGETASGAVDNKEAIYGIVSYSPKQGNGRIWGRASYSHIETGHETFGWFYDGAGQPSSFLGADFASSPARAEATRYNYSYETGFETKFEGAASVWNVRLVGRYDQQAGYEDAIIPLGFGFYDASGNLLGSTGTSSKPSQPKFSDTNWTDIRMGGTSTRRAGDPDKRPNKQYGVYLDAVGDFTTGPIKHKLLIYSQLSGNKSHGGSIGQTLNPGLTFSLINPVYHNYADIIASSAVSSKNSGSSSAFNFGIQDNLYMLDDRLIVVYGARYDHSQDNGTINELSGVRAPERTANNWVYKAGVVYKPLKNYNGISVFYNYSETFTPQNGTNLAGVPFVDLSGVANEVGFKLELIPQGIVMTASVFENKNTNFPIRVFNPVLGLDDFIQIGTGVSKGWEADIAWQPNPELSFLVALSDVDSKNPNGLRKRNVQNGFNWRFVSKYKFTDDLSAGIAAVNLADRAGDNGNTFFTEGYTTVNLFSAYDFGKWRAQVNVNNVFDGDGVESSIISSIALPQNPRSVRVSLQYTF